MIAALPREVRVRLVAEIANRGAGHAGLLLALHLFDLAPCPRCLFVHDRCRCVPATTPQEPRA